MLEIQRALKQKEWELEDSQALHRAEEDEQRSRLDEITVAKKKLDEQFLSVYNSCSLTAYT